jgi:ATP-dependent Lon protease
MGNGKTTLVKKGIAKAIGRPFHFIALGGASDSSSFDGHHYTYEGSKYGRIVEILIQSKCMNPIFYFDELDKISDTQKGEEIVHLLTHLTDTSQNDKFHDNYFSGIDIDLSKALFIFSFNDENKIDKILKDRMYVIRTKGFKTNDKLHIANDYLLPELLETYNYNDSIVFNDDIIKNIIENFTDNEQGVRNLKRCLETIISKVNMYELLYDNENDKSSIDLDYSIENFSIPYNVKENDLEILLKKNGDHDKPPEHMYV